MKRACSYIDCGSRRRHHEDQDTPRGTQTVEVPDDYPADRQVWCSLTCAAMGGSIQLNEPQELDPEVLARAKARGWIE